jgi:hypothetical protein
MPIGSFISTIGKVIAIMAVGATLSSCAGSSRVDGVLPSWANPQPQTAELAQNQTKITKREAEGRKKRESQTSQALSKPESAQQTASQGAQHPSEE